MSKLTLEEKAFVQVTHGILSSSETIEEIIYRIAKLKKAPEA